jgi:hypothetical protein
MIKNAHEELDLRFEMDTTMLYLGQVHWIGMSWLPMLLVNVLHRADLTPDTESNQGFWRLWPVLTVVKAEAQFFAWINEDAHAAPYIAAMLLFGILTILDVALYDIWIRRDIQKMMPIAGCVLAAVLLTNLAYFLVSVPAGYLMIVYAFIYELPFCFVIYMHWSKYHQSLQNPADLLMDEDLES